MENKNKEKLASFTAYCEAHPDERFWQALRNWSGYNFIYGSGLPIGGAADTFYIE
jgi:hypothetical protein